MFKVIVCAADLWIFARHPEPDYFTTKPHGNQINAVT